MGGDTLPIINALEEPEKGDRLRKSLTLCREAIE